ncbi:MAG: hypothetical protein GWP17_01150 [Aquificales bacterium]|nr:hypothetical protein [Aquificales bacterium]
MANKALVPTVQKEIVFYEDMITAVLVKVNGEDGIYVPIRPICNYLGLDWSAQYRRVNRDPVLSEVIQGVAITATPSSDGRGGGLQEMSCLPLKFLPGWLFGVNANRVKEDLREKIIRYQRESYDVLWEAFQEGRLTAGTAFEDLLEGNTPAAQAYKMASAIMKMARQQLLLEAQLETHTTQLVDHEKRLEDIETTLGDPEHHITSDQAMQVSQAVKAIAHELGKRSKRNEYGGVYGELYRRYSINSYKVLPKHKFDDTLTWLNDWLQSLINDTPF